MQSREKSRCASILGGLPGASTAELPRSYKKLPRYFIVSTIAAVQVSYDAAKNERNIRNRGLSFDRAAEFDFETAAYFVDGRKQYAEVRRIAVGYLDRRLHVLCFADIAAGIRVISFRKANKREVKKYGKAKSID